MHLSLRYMMGSLASLGMVLVSFAEDLKPVVARTGVVAIVNGREIPESAVERALKPLAKEDREKARPDTINFLIENALVDDYLDRMKIQVDAKEVDTQLNGFKSQVKDAGQDYNKILEKMELSEAELRKEIGNQLRWDKFVSTQATEDKLKKLYDNSPEFFDGSTVTVKHILLKTDGDEKGKQEALKKLQGIKADIEKKIGDAVAKIPADADNLVKEKSRMTIIADVFSAAAREHSTCPSKRDGGSLGEFGRMGTMVEPFSKAAFAQKPYQIAEPIATQHGYHLILVTNRKAGDLPKFEVIKNVISEVYGMRLREAVVTAMKGDASTKIERK